MGGMASQVSGEEDLGNSHKQKSNPLAIAQNRASFGIYGASIVRQSSDLGRPYTFVAKQGSGKTKLAILTRVD